MKTSLATAVLAALLTSAVAPAVAFAAPATTQQVAPNSASAVVLQSGNRIMTTLESRRAEFKGNPAALKAYVKSEFNRYFDAEYSARLVLGVHGRSASKAEVTDFAAAMADNLTARYGSVLLEFDTRMRFKVLSETALPGNRGMRVSTQMLRAGSKTPLPVDYLVRNVGGQWKVFDVMVEGISYVQAFKNQFAAALNQKSIREVTADLRAGHLNAGNGKGGNGKGGSR